jgi:hypothetical protein
MRQCHRLVEVHGVLEQPLHQLHIAFGARHGVSAEVLDHDVMHVVDVTVAGAAPEFRAASSRNVNAPA